jgi:hypothetical protein
LIAPLIGRLADAALLLTWRRAWRSRRTRGRLLYVTALRHAALLRSRLSAGRRCRSRRFLNFAPCGRWCGLLGWTLLLYARSGLRRRWLRARRRLHGRLLRRTGRLLLGWWRSTASLALFFDALFALLLGFGRARRLGEDGRRVGVRRRGRGRHSTDQQEWQQHQHLNAPSRHRLKRGRILTDCREFGSPTAAFLAGHGLTR